MGLAIPIETSARHIHLCREDFNILFGEDRDLTFKAELSQPGQYVCKERVAVRGPKGSFEKVAVLGPFRNETQVEISMTDSRKLGIPGVIRQSGDTVGTPGCVLEGSNGSIELDHGVIVAKRHIHMTPVQAIQLNVKDNDEVFVIMESFERSLIFADVVVRVNPNFALAMHVDTDEANAFANDNHPTGALLKLFGGRTYNLQKWAEEVQNGINRF
ncbi:phosphate propanoyltransferase [Dorea sp. YH-dor228]|uniref:phosphate propanoyltransferase n=1 Tax=Dorea sp. YH-dor228 TaxID=3151120 RepID=UPI0032423FE2